MIFFFIIRHQNPNEKHHRHSAKNPRIKFYTQKFAKIGFTEPFCRSSPNFATDLLQTCYKRLKGGLLHVSLSICKSESASLLHIKKHVDTRKSRLPFQVNGLTFGGALPAAVEPEPFIPDTVADSTNRAVHGEFPRFWCSR